MSADSSRPEENAAPPETQTTLGTLLYADVSRPRVAEAAWVSLIASIASGDVRALRTLYARVHGFVFTLALRICTDRATAEEVTADVFHEVWRRAARYSPADGTAVGWIMNLARSRAIDRLRHDTRQKRAPTSAVAEPAVTDADVVEERERAARLRGALEALGDGERAAIELAYFSDRTYAEVASTLGEPLGTIKSRIRSGLAKLRSALAHEGGS